VFWPLSNSEDESPLPQGSCSVLAFPTYLYSFDQYGLTSLMSLQLLFLTFQLLYFSGMTPEVASKTSQGGLLADFLTA